MPSPHANACPKHLAGGSQVQRSGHCPHARGTGAEARPPRRGPNRHLLRPTWLGASAEAAGTSAPRGPLHSGTTAGTRAALAGPRPPVRDTAPRLARPVRKPRPGRGRQPDGTVLRVTYHRAPVIPQQAASHHPSRFQDRSLRPPLGAVWVAPPPSARHGLRQSFTEKRGPASASDRPRGARAGPAGAPGCVRARCAPVAAPSCWGARSPRQEKLADALLSVTPHGTRVRRKRTSDAGRRAPGARSQRARRPRPAGPGAVTRRGQCRAEPPAEGTPLGHAGGGARQAVPE